MIALTAPVSALPDVQSRSERGQGGSKEPDSLRKFRGDDQADQYDHRDEASDAEAAAESVRRPVHRAPFHA